MSVSLNYEAVSHMTEPLIYIRWAVAAPCTFCPGRALPKKYDHVY